MNSIKIELRIHESNTVLHQVSYGLLVIKVEPSAKIREVAGSPGSIMVEGGAHGLHRENCNVPSFIRKVSVNWAVSLERKELSTGQS